MIYLRLFYVFAKLGLFTYGGGYAIIALLLGILEDYGWVTSAEFSNLVAISQITPGPIAINSATFVGYKVAGVLGSAVATFGIFLPAFVITMIVSKFFYAVKNNEQFNSIMNALRVCAVALINRMKSTPSYMPVKTDDEWNILFSFAETLYPGFNRSLQSASGLTMRDKEISCLVRLGFSTGQLAVFYGISPGSVTKAKFRIQKKLVADRNSVISSQMA